jgi:murein DD-endopeptidase MepM/ murein hydrolase activator NlpD
MSLHRYPHAAVAIVVTATLVCSGVASWPATSSAGVDGGPLPTVAPAVLVTTAAPIRRAAAVNSAAGATEAAVRQRRDRLVFPMQAAPRCDILDNYGDGRSGGRVHLGVDMLATLDQELYAVASGTLVEQYLSGSPNGALSGNAWKLRDPSNGAEYFYAHLSRFADGLSVGSVVTAGQLIGYVGDTGNPGTGNYHLHFEIHPGGTTTVDPLTVLTDIPDGCRIY